MYPQHRQASPSPQLEDHRYPPEPPPHHPLARHICWHSPNYRRSKSQDRTSSDGRSSLRPNGPVPRYTVSIVVSNHNLNFAIRYLSTTNQFNAAAEAGFEPTKYSFKDCRPTNWSTPHQNQASCPPRNRASSFSFRARCATTTPGDKNTELIIHISMKNFTDWMTNRLQEGVPAGWQASPMIGQDPARSLLIKIMQAEKKGEMPFDGHFTDSGVLVTRLGLTPEESDQLKKLNLLQRDQGAIAVDRSAFMRAWEFIQSRKLVPH